MRPGRDSAWMRRAKQAPGRILSSRFASLLHRAARSRPKRDAVGGIIRPPAPCLRARGERVCGGECLVRAIPSRLPTRLRWPAHVSAGLSQAHRLWNCSARPPSRALAARAGSRWLLALARAAGSRWLALARAGSRWLGLARAGRRWHFCFSGRGRRGLSRPEFLFLVGIRPRIVRRGQGGGHGGGG